MSSSSSSSSDGEGGFPLARPAPAAKKRAGSQRSSKTAKQRTIDGNDAPAKGRRKRVGLTPEDKYRIAMLDKDPQGKAMSHGEVADWCSVEGNLPVAKKPDNTTISKIRSTAEEHIRRCVSSPQAVTWCIRIGPRRVLRMG